MFVPLDRLYHYIDHVVDNDTLIYRFHPHGSKNISNIGVLDVTKGNLHWRDYMQQIHILMHDQEPLNFDLYKDIEPEEIIAFLGHRHPGFYRNILACGLQDKMIERFRGVNLDIINGFVLADRWMLCHSEQNSPELDRYTQIGAVGVYWWSHAVIAKDWYRYARIDPKLRIGNYDFEKDFNVYCRSWTGTREYRLKFVEMIHEHDLIRHAKIGIAIRDQGVSYDEHAFQNPAFRINRDLAFLAENKPSAEASADYCAQDYLAAGIDVVLETLFDDVRVQLTEKILRPIACGKPFLLVSTPGALQYLRNYGFQTFDTCIDESYDQIQDPLARLMSVIKIMEHIGQMPKRVKAALFDEMHCIAAQNQKWFWSDQFSQMIMDEFRDNYRIAAALVRQSKQGQKWLDIRKYFAGQSQTFRHILCQDNGHRSRRDIVDILRSL